MSALIDMTGERCGSLDVGERGPSDKHGKARFWVTCAHGFRFLVVGSSLRRGLTTSCRSQCPFCPRGHDTRVTGKYGRGCAECIRDNERAMRIAGRSWYQRPENRLVVRQNRTRRYLRQAITNAERRAEELYG